MHFRLIFSQIVNIYENLYYMVFWCDDISEVEIPDNMNCIGGSMAIETDATNEVVSYYVYDETSSEWIKSV